LPVVEAVVALKLVVVMLAEAILVADKTGAHALCASCVCARSECRTKVR
jgi:hypothetical protein